MADNGQRNVILSLDIKNARIKVMKILGQSQNNSIIEFLPFDRDLVIHGEYGKMFETGLARYVERANLRFAAFYIVLPDEAVTCWKVSVPSLSKIKTEEALKAEIAVDLGEPKDFIFNYTLISSSKKLSVYEVCAVRRDVYNEVKNALTRLGIDIRAVTYNSSAVTNAFFALRTKARQGTYLITDMREGETVIALVSKEKLMASTTLPFGYEMLRTDGIVDENSLLPHDSATIVVAKAMETTTRIKNEGERTEDLITFDLESVGNQMMTTADITEFSEAVDEAIRSAAEENAANAQEHTDEMSDTDMEIERRFDEATNTHTMEDVTTEPDNSNTSDMSVTGNFTDTDLSIDAVSHRDMAERNFQTVYKHILLFCDAIKDDPDLPNPDHITMNIPKRFAFLLARANKDASRLYDFKYFNPSIEADERFTENLELYGALFTKVYNKNRSF